MPSETERKNRAFSIMILLGAILFAVAAWNASDN